MNFGETRGHRGHSPAFKLKHVRTPLGDRESVCILKTTLEGPCIWWDYYDLEISVAYYTRLKASLLPQGI